MTFTPVHLLRFLNESEEFEDPSLDTHNPLVNFMLDYCDEYELSDEEMETLKRFLSQGGDFFNGAPLTRSAAYKTFTEVLRTHGLGGERPDSMGGVMYRPGDRDGDEFVGESTMPSPEEVARYRQSNLRRNGAVRAEMDAAWQAKREEENNPLRQKIAARRKQNEMERMFRAHETGNDALLNHSNTPTPLADVMGQENEPESEPVGEEPTDQMGDEGQVDEDGLVWHSFDEVPGIGEEQEERDMAFDPMGKTRDFRNSMRGKRDRVPSRRPQISEIEDSDF